MLVFCLLRKSILVCAELTTLSKWRSSNASPLRCKPSEKSPCWAASLPSPKKNKMRLPRFGLVSATGLSLPFCVGKSLGCDAEIPLGCDAGRFPRMWRECLLLNQIKSAQRWPIRTHRAGMMIQPARWEMKHWTHFEVKLYKTHQRRTAWGTTLHQF